MESAKRPTVGRNTMSQNFDDGASWRSALRIREGGDRYGGVEDRAHHSRAARLPLPSESTHSKPVALRGGAVLLALFLTGVIAGKVFAWPIPAPVVGLALVLLGLRVGVMTMAVGEPDGTAGEGTAPGG
jgi:hypothetical protein